MTTNSRRCQAFSEAAEPGFCNRRVNLVMKCISTVSYHIRVNGQLTDEIMRTEGELRQGILCRHISFRYVLKASRHR
ncbi:hypothetical protein Zm00014a_031219 [Zea mays]|uniref:Uncharacterized protein n=1 Tax=Zea mays TaxID=4577 RepID=A0A3L6FQI4_MAIZE|nr:hypothetical protein Zm00014a_031219 [Zea mays]